MDIMFVNKKDKCIVYIESEKQLEQMSKNNPGKGRLIDILMIPMEIKNTWRKKFINIAASVLPCIKPGGKIVYYE